MFLLRCDEMIKSEIVLMVVDAMFYIISVVDVVVNCIIEMVSIFYVHNIVVSLNSIKFIGCGGTHCVAS